LLIIEEWDLKVDVVIRFIEKFILDVIGVILPGLFLLVGLKYVLIDLLSFDGLRSLNFGDNNFVIAICFCYICGHGLHVIGDKILCPLVSKWIKIKSE